MLRALVVALILLLQGCSKTILLDKGAAFDDLNSRKLKSKGVIYLYDGTLIKGTHIVATAESLKYTDLMTDQRQSIPSNSVYEIMYVNHAAGAAKGLFGVGGPITVLAGAFGKTSMDAGVGMFMGGVFGVLSGVIGGVAGDRHHYYFSEDSMLVRRPWSRNDNVWEGF